MAKRSDGPTIPNPCTAEHVRQRTAKPMWLLPHIQLIDSALSGRWPWWIERLLQGELGDHQIPQINFRPFPSRRRCEYPRFEKEVGSGADILKQFLGAIEHARMEGQSVYRVLQWFLYGLETGVERPQFSDDLEIRLYQDGVQALCRMMAIPGDWGADVMAEVVGGGNSNTGWFPTPGSIAQVMYQMTVCDGRDTRAWSMHDPCVGTGVFLLYGSNHCLDLTASDIDPTMVAWTKLQSYLFAPWAVYGDKNLIREIREHRAKGIAHGQQHRDAHTVKVGKKRVSKARPMPKKAKRRP